MKYVNRENGNTVELSFTTTVGSSNGMVVNDRFHCVDKNSN